MAQIFYLQQQISVNNASFLFAKLFLQKYKALARKNYRLQLDSSLGKHNGPANSIVWIWFPRSQKDWTIHKVDLWPPFSFCGMYFPYIHNNNLKTEKEMITDDSQFLMELCHPPYFKIQEVKNTFNMPKMKLKA